MWPTKPARVMRAAHERGLAVGRGLALAGYDGAEDAERTQPPLSTLKQSTFDTARRLVKMLIARIQGKELADPQVTIQPDLIVRASTGG